MSAAAVPRAMRARPSTLHRASMSPSFARPAARAATFALLLRAVPAVAQTGPAPPVVGRWDLRVTDATGATYPSWLEVERSGDRALVGRFVGRVGNARPIGRIAGGRDSVRFAIPPQWETGDADLQFAGALSGDRLAGTIVALDGTRQTVTGVRAPALRRAADPAWGSPVTIFDGRDLAGWTTIGTGPRRWRAVGGVLTNTGPGANLATTRRLDDFRLHVEVRIPPGGNSGIYLRGRYEVQVEDDEVPAAARATTEPASTHIGGVYGFLVPNEYAGRPAGSWQAYDITLVGRRVTVVLNGRTVIADQLIPGITGGALDSDEGAPGPLVLQGDHGLVEYRNVRLTLPRRP